MISFQCELCHLKKLKGLDPGNRDSNVRLLRTIRRATLDAFWVREPSIINATRRDSKRIEEISRSLGLDETLPGMEPFVLKYTQGMDFVVCILIRSLDKGRH